jgi:prepilin-type N-terminal cleavage/methylation domain-containing protein
MDGIRSTRGRGRRGFSLVELLVAMALVVFIMSIVSWAFQLAGKTVSTLKAAGDLAEQLRGVTTLLRRDLSAPHFVPGNVRLSEVAGPNQGGYFRILQNGQALSGPPAPGLLESPTFVTTTTSLQFTVVLPANLPGDFYTTNLGAAGGDLFDPNYLTNNLPAGTITATSGIPAGYTTLFNQDQRYQTPFSVNNAPTGNTLLRSQYAEVAWWLTPSTLPGNANAQAFTAADAGQTAQPLFTLRRRQLLVWPSPPENSFTPTNAKLASQIPPYPTITFNQSAAGGGPSLPPPPSYYPNLVPNATKPNQTLEFSLPVPGMQVPANSIVQPNTMAQLTIPAYRFAQQVNLNNGGNVLPFSDPTWAGVSSASTVAQAVPNSYPEQVAGTGRVDDIVIDNVLSFDVRILVGGVNPSTPTFPAFVDLYDPVVAAFDNGNLAFPFTTVVGGKAALNTAGTPRCYDTWSNQKTLSPVVVGQYTNGAPGNVPYDYVTPPVAPNLRQATVPAPTPPNTVPPPWQIPTPQGANPPLRQRNYAAMPLWRNIGRLPATTVGDPLRAAYINSTNFEIIAIQAIQITLRLYDPKSQMTRQVTMVQLM